MDIGDRVRRLRQTGRDLRLLTFQFGHSRLHGGLVESILDRRHDTRYRTLDLRKCAGVGFGLNPLLTVLTVDVGGIGGPRRFDLVGRSEEPTSDIQSLMPIPY